MKPKRLVCVVEGKGEVDAFPNLCARIAKRLNVWNWVVDPHPVRQSRGLLVDESVRSPNRPAASVGLQRAVRLAAARPATAVLVTCDSDDDCAGVWGPSADSIIHAIVPGGAVMVVREYETWLLHSIEKAARDTAGLGVPEATRDAKGLMRLFVSGYKPTIHQLSETRRLRIDDVWAASDSFDKLVRTLAAIFGVAPPLRPLR